MYNDLYQIKIIFIWLVILINFDIVNYLHEHNFFFKFIPIVDFNLLYNN